MNYELRIMNSLTSSWLNHDIYDTARDGNGLNNLHTLEVLLSVGG